MKSFTFIVGPIAAGKTTFMEKKLYNGMEGLCNFFDHDQAKLMIQLYAPDKVAVNDLNLGYALNNAIQDSIDNDKDFMMQIHFTTEQLPQINTYLHRYSNKFQFNAHFIAVHGLEILKERASKRELLGGHSSERKSIEKSYKQSFRNFATYLPKFHKAIIWDNTKEFGFLDMQEQLVYENGTLVYQNPSLTEYSEQLLQEVNSPSI